MPVIRMRGYYEEMRRPVPAKVMGMQNVGGSFQGGGGVPGV